MKTEKHRNVFAGIGWLAAFVIWTLMLGVVDVQAIGPEGSRVGLAGMNRCFHSLTGVHMALYTLTDWLSLIPVGLAAGFGVLGLKQWIQRRRLWRVDRNILVLGCFLAAVAAAYCFFEMAAVNQRPVLIEGRLETSYPSSTTMLVLCVMPAVGMQLKAQMQSRLLSRWITAAIIAFTAFMVLGRLVSGVHWLSDIIGGALLSAGLVMLYAAFLKK